MLRRAPKPTARYVPKPPRNTIASAFFDGFYERILDDGSRVDAVASGGYRLSNGDRLTDLHEPLSTFPPQLVPISDEDDS